MYFMSDPQALHGTRNVIPGKLGVDLHLHRVHIPLVASSFITIRYIRIVTKLLVIVVVCILSVSQSEIRL